MRYVRKPGEPVYDVALRSYDKTLALRHMKDLPNL